MCILPCWYFHHFTRISTCGPDINRFVYNYTLVRYIPFVYIPFLCEVPAHADMYQNAIFPHVGIFFCMWISINLCVFPLVLHMDFRQRYTCLVHLYYLLNFECGSVNFRKWKYKQTGVFLHVGIQAKLLHAVTHPASSVIAISPMQNSRRMVFSHRFCPVLKNDLIWSTIFHI